MNKKAHFRIYTIFIFVGLVSLKVWAVDTTVKTSYPKEKKFCVLETRTIYNGSNDTLETAVTCDGDATTSLETLKIEKTDDLKNDSKQFTLHVKKMLDEGYKILSCQTHPPVTTPRYTTRYSCTFGR